MDEVKIRDASFPEQSGGGISSEVEAILRLSPLSCDVISLLLDLLERHGRKRRAIAKIDEERFADYFSANNHTYRETVNEEMGRLSTRVAGISLQWRRDEENNWLSAVLAEESAATSLCQLIGRRPAEAKKAELRWAVAEIISAAPDGEIGRWPRRLAADLNERLSTGRAILPFRLGEDLFNRDLLLGVRALSVLAVPELARKVSSRIFKRSKRLEALVAPLATLTRRYALDSGEDFEGDDWAALGQLNLLKTPEDIVLWGSVIIEGDDGRTFDTASPASSVGLPALKFANARCLSVPPGTPIITVENKTSFVDLVAGLSRSRGVPTAVVVYTGGFAGPGLVHLLRRLAVESGATLHHWGDLDGGGYRILSHLRMVLPTEVRSVAMGTSAVNNHLEILSEAADKDIPALIAASKKTSLTLDERMAALDLSRRRSILEQEAVSPEFVISVVVPAA